MMNLYIWENVYELTGKYHCSGSAVVVAGTLERAREILTEISDKLRGCGRDYDPPEWVNEEPVALFALKANQGESVRIFKDAGCCGA